MSNSSADPRVREVKSLLRSDRTLKNAQCTERDSKAQEALSFEEIRDHTQVDRHNVGWGRIVRSQATVAVKSKSKLIIQERRKEVMKVVKGHATSPHGRWTTWDEAFQRAITWKEILSMPLTSTNL